MAQLPERGPNQDQEAGDQKVYICMTYLSRKLQLSLWSINKKPRPRLKVQKYIQRRQA